MKKNMPTPSIPHRMKEIEKNIFHRKIPPRIPKSIPRNIL